MQRIFIINLYFRVEGVHNFSFLIINLFSATLGFLEICWRLVNGHEHEMFETKLLKWIYSRFVSGQEGGQLVYWTLVSGKVGVEKILNPEQGSISALVTQQIQER